MVSSARFLHTSLLFALSTVNTLILFVKVMLGRSGMFFNSRPAPSFPLTEFWSEIDFSAKSLFMYVSTRSAARTLLATSLL